MSDARDAAAILKLLTDDFSTTITSRFVVLLNRFAQARSHGAKQIDCPSIKKDLSEIVVLYEGLLQQIYKDLYHPGMDVINNATVQGEKCAWLDGFSLIMDCVLQDLAVKESILQEIKSAYDAPASLLDISPETVRIYTHALSVHPTIDTQSPAFGATVELTSLYAR
jgi:hypothetical protein